MQSTDDSVLLRQYAGNNSGDAFAALVTRHINLVYSVALRQVGNPHHAEEITQVVFIILAKKAGELRHDKALSSWLFRVTRLTANNFVRSEIRRQRREQEAFMRTILNESGNEAWPGIAPLLDTAVAGLSEKDRRAILLRFYEGRNLSEVGAVLGASEDAAKKRVNRAVEKLRVFFTKRGVVLPATVLTAAISANSAQAAPAMLAKTITAVAMTKGVAASGSTLTLINGALKLMAWTNMKTVVVVGVVVILTAGTTTVVVQHQPHFPKPQAISAAETVFPKSTWNFAGFTDPQSALVSALWAQTKSNSKTFLASLTPEGKQKQQAQIKDTMRKTGKSEAVVFAESARRMDKTLGFQVLGQEMVSDNQVLLHLYIQGNEIQIDAKMIKIGNDWKLDDFVNEKRLSPK
jgi:RNA polymerase sigma factor (sigma-70 family)